MLNHTTFGAKFSKSRPQLTHRRDIALDERDVRRTPRQRLQAQCAAAGEEVQTP
jgi:hypothetical protein